QRDAGGLVAHVGAVRQVVGAVRPGEQLPQEGRLVGGAAGGVEDGLVRVGAGAQLAGEQVQRLVPADRGVVVRAGAADHGRDEASLPAEPVVGTGGEVADRVGGEELGPAAAQGRLVRH